MPTFDFQCRECQYTFEFSRPFGSKKNPPCPKCASKNIDKLIAPPAIHFKGTGFYKTDSRTTKEEKSDAPVKEPKKEEKKSEAPASTPNAPAKEKPSKTDTK